MMTTVVKPNHAIHGIQDGRIVRIFVHKNLYYSKLWNSSMIVRLVGLLRSGGQGSVKIGRIVGFRFYPDHPVHPCRVLSISDYQMVCG